LTGPAPILEPPDGDRQEQVGEAMNADSAAPSLLERLLRPGRSSNRDVVVDLLWLLGLGLLLIGAGLGLRDPWPADEPRFALIAQDMLRSSDWLFPRVSGDLYADKPPLYFWLMAASMAATGSLRVGFLLPSLLSGLGTVVLVYDLLRRARGREVALAGGLLLLLTFQFVWQARQAQIDATLCFLTTLSLYGLLRHLALGPARIWFLAGWAAAGLGVITKGVGFLPLLILVLVRTVRCNEELRKLFYFVSSLLILLGIFSMRWNVVIGGQLFSKSFRGLMAYKMELTGIESLLTALLLLALPFVILTVLFRLLPPRWLDEHALSAR